MRRLTRATSAPTALAYSGVDALTRNRVTADASLIEDFRPAEPVVAATIRVVIESDPAHAIVQYAADRR